jgi:hypothetical protein
LPFAALRETKHKDACMKSEGHAAGVSLQMLSWRVAEKAKFLT